MRRTLEACLFLATTALAMPAFATPSVVPLYRNWDENNVDVVRGDFRLNFEEASIGSGNAPGDHAAEHERDSV